MKLHRLNPEVVLRQAQKIVQEKYGKHEGIVSRQILALSESICEEVNETLEQIENCVNTKCR